MAVLTCHMLLLLQDLAAAERGKRVAQNERDEANEELTSANSAKNSLTDEKKRLEARVTALEDEMEEEAGNTELAVEKARKLQTQVRVFHLQKCSSQGSRSENSYKLIVVRIPSYSKFTKEIATLYQPALRYRYLYEGSKNSWNG